MAYVDALSAAPEPPSFGRRAGTLVRDMRDVACDHLELAALEAQRAWLSLTRMLCAAVVISILVVSSWLALIAGGIVWATTAGVSWAAALVVTGGVNLLLAGVLAFWIRRQAGERIFAATLRQLRRAPDAAVGDAA